MVRDFQKVIGQEIRAQLMEKKRKTAGCGHGVWAAEATPSARFYEFIDEPSVRLIGCEAAGRQVDTLETAATVATGKLGIFHGMKSYFCQDENGQIAPVYSISAGLDYPGVGPEHAMLHARGRAEYVPVTDDEAVDAFEYLCAHRGDHPAIERARRGVRQKSWRRPCGGIRSSWSTFPAVETRTWPPSRGTGGCRSMSKIAQAFAGKKGAHWLCDGQRPQFGDDGTTGFGHGAGRRRHRGDRHSFSDPTAEGPVIEAASMRALAAGCTVEKLFALVQKLRERVRIPLLFMTYANPSLPMAKRRSCGSAARSGSGASSSRIRRLKKRTNFWTPARRTASTDLHGGAHLARAHQRHRKGIAGFCTASRWA